MKLVAVIVAFILQGVAQAPSATIEGIVESESGQLLAGAQVTLTGAGGPARIPSLQGITIRLMPAGNVNGHVRKTNGRPAPGVTVQLIRRNWDANGRLSTSSVVAVKSDDRGAFRFYWVTPGRYYVVAGAPTSSVTSLNGNGNNNNEVTENYPYTFFPGSTDFEKALRSM